MYFIHMQVFIIKNFYYDVFIMLIIRTRFHGLKSREVAFVSVSIFLRNIGTKAIATSVATDY